MSRKTLALLAVLIALPSTAFALDDVGKTGRIADLQVNLPSSNTYLAYHGRVFIGTGKEVDEYRWGGVSCGSNTLSEHAVTLLMRALDSGLRVEPRYKAGQGPTTKCLIGFNISG
jgi:hypothetical protein